jgi:hypothetical protein
MLYSPRRGPLLDTMSLQNHSVIHRLSPFAPVAAVLLLLCQVAGFSHHAVHDGDPPGEPCEVCTLLSQLDDAQVQLEPSVVIPGLYSAPGSPLSTSLSIATRRYYRSRAPPRRQSACVC